MMRMASYRLDRLLRAAHNPRCDGADSHTSLAQGLREVFDERADGGACLNWLVRGAGLLIRSGWVVCVFGGRQRHRRGGSACSRATVGMTVMVGALSWGLPTIAAAQTATNPFGSLSEKVDWSGDNATQNQSSVGQLIDAGRTALAAGDAQAASQQFSAALKQAPDDPALLNNLATARAMLGDTGGALQLLRRAVVIAPDREDIRANLRTLSDWMQRQTPGLVDENGADADRALSRQGVTSGVQPW